MFRSLATIAGRRPRRVVLAVLAFMVLAALLGGSVVGRLSTGDDFSDPGSQSSHAQARLAQASGTEATPSVVALVRLGGPLNAQPARTRVQRVVSALASDSGIGRVDSYPSTHDHTMVSRNGTMSYVTAYLRNGVSSDQVAARVKRRLSGLSWVTLGGDAFSGLGGQIGQDLGRAEALAFPIVFVLAVLLFRGVLAAMLPLFIGALTLLGTLLGLRLINGFTPLSIYALNLAIALGLGLGIDYSLLIVSRYREEASKTGWGTEALARTLSTAGRTVLFSSLTVAAALLALLVFPERFLYSMGISGALTALLGAAAALLALPALLALLGPRAGARTLRRRRQRAAGAERGEAGFWYRLAHGVMRRPAPIAVLTATLLLAAGSPVTHIRFTGVDMSVLPSSSPAKQVDQAIKAAFPPTPYTPTVVAVHAGQGARTVRPYADRLAALPGVAEVSPPRFEGADTWAISVTSKRPLFDSRSLALVRAVRAIPAPFPVQVGGESAAFIDERASLLASLAIALVLLTATSLTILFVMTRSVILPIKALVMNLLTISAAFGLLVLVFQDGHLQSVLGYHSNGAIDLTQPLVLMAVVFGLSTDYGVFLLTRIKEAHDGGLTNREAVAVGLQRTGSIVTAASLLFAIAVAAFATSQLSFIKELGLGTAAAVLIDASIIRVLLVPSLMALLGERNWWAPRLRRRPTPQPSSQVAGALSQPQVPAV